MTVPRINKSRLQRVVADIEFDQTLEFEALCAAVANGQWGKNLQLNPEDAGVLMIQHDIITKGDKPESWPVADEPEPVVELPSPEVVPEPVVAAEPVAEKKPLPDGVSTFNVDLDAHPELDPDAEPAEPAAEPAAEPVTSGVKTYDVAGRGRKPCPECDKYVGLRVQECACGHKFESKKAKKPDGPPAVPMPTAVLDKAHAIGKGCTMIATPAGEPPAKLAGTSEKEVLAWTVALRKHGETLNKFFTVRALVYWVRYYYDHSSPEFKEVRRIIERIYADEVAA